MRTAEIRDDWVGRIIDGRFTLLQWLGGTERSVVYLTELSGPGSQKVSIKLIWADAADAEDYIAGWAATAAVSHPHLVRIYHTGQGEIDSTRLVYAVTEYAEEVLSEIIPERALTPAEADEMLAPVLDALSYLHSKGFVHGHLKPSNIMVVDDQVKLSGDGLEITGEPGKHFPPFRVYDAPEVATERISPAADVWSLGVTLVEALTQHPPVWDRSESSEPAVPESVPQPFADIARQCLRLNPAHRCTVRDIKARLEPDESAFNSVSEGPKPDSAKLRVTVLIAAVLVLLAAIAALQLRSHATRSSVATATPQAVPANAAPPTQSPVAEPQTPQGAPVKGSVAEQVLPDVPRSASRTIRGKVEVRIRVMVDPNGNVQDANFDSPGVSKYFAKLALQAARKWKFKPAQVGDRAVPSVWLLRFQFRQTGTEVIPTEVSP